MKVKLPGKTLDDTNNSHIINCFEYLLKMGVTDKKDMYLLIRKRFDYTSSEVSAAKKVMVDKMLKKYNILSKGIVDGCHTGAKKVYKKKAEEPDLIQITALPPGRQS